MNNRLAVVVPAYNEEGSIAETIDHLLAQQDESPEAVVVVDNASSDRTPQIVRALQDQYPNLHVVNESQKGTGNACNTGFRYAIDEIGADVIARTDSDTLAHSGWVSTIDQYFSSHPHKVLISGPSYPKHDEFQKPYDKVLWPFLRDAYRIGNVAVTRSFYPLRFAIGHNMAVRAQAFDRVGGFSNTTIAEADEDVELTKKIHAEFGYSATDYLRELTVSTSMRRVRKLGYLGLMRYYWNPSTPPSPERRRKMTGNEIDIR